MGAENAQDLAIEEAVDSADPRAQLRDQDAEFCRRMRAAIERGSENCPIGVSIEPCTKRPVMADGWKVA